MTLALALLAGLLATAALAADTCYTLTLAAATPDGVPTTIRLMMTDGKLTGGMVGSTFADVTKVTIDEKSLKGDVKAGEDAVALDATLDDKGAATGTYKGTLGGKVVDGKLTGTRAASDWSAWRGPDGSGMGIGAGVPLVDDLADMKLVWQSEARGIPANAWHNSTQGGYDSPIVANGKVFISYFKGAGDILDTSIQDRGLKPEQLKWAQAVATEDTVLCLDAKTGKTLWTQVLGEGVNLYQRRKSGPHQGVCWYNGKVYAQDTLGRVYCLNQDTGEIIWKADVPATAQNAKVLEAYKKAAKQHPYRGVEPPELNKCGMPYLFMSTTVVADGVVVVDGGGKLAAFDAEIGTPVTWKAGIGASGNRSGMVPLRWTSEGKEFLFLGGACVKPKTGEAVWKLKESVGRTPALGEGYLVGLTSTGYVCYRLSATKAEKVWENLDYGGSGAMAGTGVIANGWFFAEVHPAGGRAKMPPKATELAIGIELATGKVVGPAAFEGVSQTLCTTPVGMDGRWFFHVGAGYSGMVMMTADGADFKQVGLRMPTGKSWMPLPGGTKATTKLDYCLTSTPAMANGFMYFRGSDSLWCYDLRKPVKEKN
jgi:outer membrane protein assembly factor BamB